MARVNVEQKALTDSRMGILGKLLGGDHRLAIGYMVYVWNECTERNIYTLTDRELISLSGNADFPKLLIESGLGERNGEGVRIRGTKDRIEWLATKRANAKKG